jgi:hypothetical protein
VSDTSQGPGWWQASDGKWYPPEQAPGYQPPVAGAGGLPDGGGGTDLGTTLGYAWNKFVQNIGEWIVLWLIMIGITILFGVLAAALVVGSSMGGFSLRFNFVGIIIGIVAGVVQGVLLVIISKGAAQATSGQKVDIGACFKLTSNNIIAGAIFGVAYGLLTSFCSIFGVVAFLFLGFLPILSALDDKGADAVGESVNLSTSRANEAMVYWLIAWLIAGLLCFIGAPIAMIGGTYLVKRYRGEPVAA